MKKLIMAALLVSVLAACNGLGGLNFSLPRVSVDAGSGFTYGAGTLSGSLAFRSEAGVPGGIVKTIQITLSNGNVVTFIGPRVAPGCAIDTTNTFEFVNALCKKLDSARPYGLDNATLVKGIPVTFPISITAAGLTSAVVTLIEVQADNGASWGTNPNLPLFKVQ